MTNIIDLSQFGELSEQELLLIEGGSWSDFFNGVLGGLCIAAAPILGVAVGVGTAATTIFAPEPTMTTKYGGIGAIAYGGTTFVKGVSEFIENIQ